MQFPVLLEILKYIGACYLLYLAWKMFGSLNISITSEKSSPLKYYEAILFQFVNPKAWVICITAVSLFYPQKENLMIGTLFSSYYVYDYKFTFNKHLGIWRKCYSALSKQRKVKENY